MKKVAIIMGSDSDLPVVSKAADTLKQFGVPYELHIYSAHRTPVEAKEFSENARANGFGVSSQLQAWLLTLQVLSQLTQPYPLSVYP